MTKDINPSGSSYPTDLTQVGNKVFFVANDGVHGTELWKSDGTAAGTKMVKDIKAGAKSSYPGDLVNVNGTLFFTATDGTHGRELWKSNGTKAGTVMVKDINTHGKNSYCGNGIYMPYAPIAVGNRLFFFLHCGGVWSPSLYVSDGTAAGTYWLDAPPISSSGDETEGVRVMDALGSQLYFVVDNEDTDGQEIWISDGTEAGTHAMAGSPTADNISFLPVHGQSLYFATYSGYIDDWPTQIQLWKTDGTKQGTKALTSAGELGVVPTLATYMGKRLYFDSRYWDDATNRYYVQLWKTDGSASGTKPIFTNQGYWISNLTATDSRLYFTLETHLWKSAGTATGAVDLGEFGSSWPAQLVNVAGTLCFIERNVDDGTWSLWESDGTRTSTYKVGTFAGNPDEVQEAAVGSRLFFAANDITHGMELWSYTP